MRSLATVTAEVPALATLCIAHWLPRYGRGPRKPVDRHRHGLLTTLRARFRFGINQQIQQLPYGLLVDRRSRRGELGFDAVAIATAVLLLDDVTRRWSDR